MNMLARTPKQMGQIIQRQRKALGMSQTDLAARTGVRQELISRIESGHDGAKIATICELLAALGHEMTVGPRSKSSSADIRDIF
ncbi:MAG: helix-turn-helix transcriptional regulator [Oceanicaulis sp.]|uniref:helix-turn-helix domain-containing protein n=1 Tax=Glycocaulis sp. TaxID=1969725 RepID=UPI0025BE4EB8|nr:helix-turn-helix transcriptional regulator [Glycocaulis sp.]MCC5982680.1 helix-turn-helix transcriptional regulator [Oceanicaulis sp.]MCH8522839.1 helix-turn-helix domain-containing protein [Glycocaulis sp.]